MTLTRITGKVFGGDAPANELGIFGSAKAGQGTNPTTAPYIEEIQSLEAYSQGWGAGVVTDKNFPPMEEVTGVLKTISYQTCYLLEAGIPTYDAGTTYGVGDIVKSINGQNLTLYVSLQDNNLNKWGDSTFWKPAIIEAERRVGVPQVTLDNVLPSGCIWLEGAIISRTDYSSLFSIYGTTYGAGNGSTTFQLPDFRNRYICGVDNNLAFGYVAAGLPNLGLSTVSSGAHTHARGTMEIEGEFLDLISHDTQTMGNASGAFATKARNNNAVHAMSGGATGSTTDGISFKASRSWTGATTSSGSHTHTITSSSSLYGTTNTIKTNGIKVRVYTRYE